MKLDNATNPGILRYEPAGKNIQLFLHSLLGGEAFYCLFWTIFLIKTVTNSINIFNSGGQMNVNWVDIRDRRRSMTYFAHELGHNLGMRFLLQKYHQRWRQHRSIPCLFTSKHCLHSFTVQTVLHCWNSFHSVARRKWHKWFRNQEFELPIIPCLCH